MGQREWGGMVDAMHKRLLSSNDQTDHTSRPTCCLDASRWAGLPQRPWHQRCSCGMRRQHPWGSRPARGGGRRGLQRRHGTAGAGAGACRCAGGVSGRHVTRKEVHDKRYQRRRRYLRGPVSEAELWRDAHMHLGGACRATQLTIHDGYCRSYCLLNYPCSLDTNRRQPPAHPPNPP